MTRRFTEEQIFQIMREQEAGERTADVCQRHGISQPTLYKWRAKLRSDRSIAVSPQEIWAMDFVHDQLATGRKLRMLTVVDTYSRYCPVIDPRFSYRGEDVVNTLERVCSEIGYPKVIRVDQGTEFVSRDMDL